MNRRMGQHAVIYSYSRILLSHKKEQTIMHTQTQVHVKSIMLSKRSQMPKSTFYKLTALEGPRPAKSIYDGKTQNSGSLRVEVGANWEEAPGNILG